MKRFLSGRGVIAHHVIVLACALAALHCGGNAHDKPVTVEAKSSAAVTFVELGSVSCIPCKEMQPVMRSIETKYGDQVRVIFYDVRTSEHSDKIAQYAVRLIPTQVFLDSAGTEFARHEGFYPESEIDQLLQSRGLKLSSNEATHD